MHFIPFEVMKYVYWNNLISLNISSSLVVGTRTSATTSQFGLTNLYFLQLSPRP